MSSNSKAGRPRVQNERLEVSPHRDALKCYARYKDKLSPEEQKWMENFHKGYYRGDKDALKKICPDKEKRQEILDEYNYNHNSSQRYTPTESKRASGYSENDYIPAKTSAEDALIEVIDSTKPEKRP